MRRATPPITWLVLCAFLFVPSWYAVVKRGSASDYGFSMMMINYEGGFKRRGLLGEVYMRLFETFNLSPWNSALFTFIFLQLLLFVLLAILLVMANSNWISYAIVIMSPAFLLFGAYSPGVLLRTDMGLYLTFTITALLACMYGTSRLSLNQYRYLIAFLIAPLLVLMTLILDLSVLFLPFIGSLLYLPLMLASRKARKATISRKKIRFDSSQKLIIFALLPSLVAGLVSYLYHFHPSRLSGYDLAFERASRAVNVSGGAFDWPNLGFQSHLSQTIDENLAHPSVAFWYLFFIILGPVALYLLLTWGMKTPRWIFVIAISPAAALFGLADWGRWISLVTWGLVVAALAMRILMPIPQTKEPTKIVGTLLIGLILIQTLYHIPNQGLSPGLGSIPHVFGNNFTRQFQNSVYVLTGQGKLIWE